MRLPVYFALLGAWAFLLGTSIATSCPCEVCPCYCPCTDRRQVRIAFVQYHDYSSVQPDDSWSRNGLQLYYGVEQAARDRGLQLVLYRHFNADDARRFQRDALDGSIDAVVATLYSEMYMEPLLSAVGEGIPIYMVGSTTPALLNKLRAGAARIHASSPFTSGHSTLVNLGVLADALAQQLASHLLSIGIHRVDCIYSSDSNIAFLERCLTIEREFKAAGMYGATHMHTRAFVPLALALETLASDMATTTPGIPVFQTALVVMDTVMYNLVRDVKGVKRVLEGGHVATFEPFPGALEDVASGRAVTVVDRPLYSQGYIAVALAAYELQTGLALAADLPTAARVISAGQVTPIDILRQACRNDGYPVCDDPGVLPVSPSGCPCFNRSDVAVRVLGTIPTRTPAYAYVEAGLLDAQRDFAGSSFLWDAGTSDAYLSIVATASVNASLASNNWTAIVSFDQWLAPVDAILEEAMRRLGATKGDRPFWLGLARGNESDYHTAEYLAQYFADGYLGPSRTGWRSVGAFARNIPLSSAAAATFGEPAADAGPVEQNTLLYLPLQYMPGWMEIAHQLVEGFFNGSLPFPDGFWGFPVKGDLDNRTGVWSTFYDGWPVPPVATGSTREQLTENVTRDEADSENPSPWKLDSRIMGGAKNYPPPTLVIRPAPPAFSSRSPFVEGLQSLLQSASMAEGSYKSVVVSPVIADDVPLALELMEEMSWMGYLNGTQLLSMECFAPDYQAFAYPGSMIGGWRHGACLDWQIQLITYTAYMLSVLRQHTHGERPLFGELPTERLMTRDQPAARKRRAADCLLYRKLVDPYAGSNATFPVCNYSAGCGPNVSHPCSGHGECVFPTAHDNAKAAAVGWLDPTVGWCVCKWGHEGRFCEGTRLVHKSRLTQGLMAVGGIVGFACLASLVFLLYKGGKHVNDAQKRRRQLEARKKKPPSKDQPVAIVHAEIEGSATLWEWDPATWGHSVQIYQRVLRAILPQHHGYLSHVDGDIFEAVFHDASDALHWALNTQLSTMRPEAVPGLVAKGGSLPPFPLSWPEKVLSHPLGEEVYDKDNFLIYRGPRVRVGIHVGVPSRTAPLPMGNGRQRYLGAAVEFAKAIMGVSDQGGHILMSMDAWTALDAAAPSSDDLHMVVFNMGEHVVAKDGPTTQLMQVIPQSLVHRAPFRPLRSYLQLSPSFFDAPGADSYTAEMPPTRPVGIVFTFIGAGPRLKAHPEYAASVELLSSFTRRILTKYRGYECEEKNGNFLLSFGDAMDAAMFTQELQAGAIYLPWPEMILDHPAAAEVLMPESIPVSMMTHDPPLSIPVADEHSDKRDKFIYRGLRIKIGIYWDVPTRCMPHASTGRAAYFGPLMNRAARIASTAASGQTLCNAEAVGALQAALDEKASDLLFSSLGQTMLKGVSTPVEIFQVSSSAISARAFPRLTRLSRAMRMLPGPFIPGQQASSVDEPGVWAATEASRFFNWQDRKDGPHPADLHRGSINDSVSSVTEGSFTVSYSDQVSRWEVEIAVPVNPPTSPSSDAGSPKGKKGRRPSRGRLSLDSLVHALDKRIHTAFGKVLPMQTGGGDRPRRTSRELDAPPEEGESGSGMGAGGAVEVQNHFLCGISFPDADAGIEDIRRGVGRTNSRLAGMEEEV
eukprot:jgi/Mesvir1/25735/Mv01917-RA.1